MEGDDTQTKITIVDEDRPGTICFEETQYSIKNTEDKIQIKLLRVDGSDGRCSVRVRTEAISDNKGLSVDYAREGADYVGFEQKIEFDHNVSEQIITIGLKPPTPQKQMNTAINETGEEQDEGETGEEESNQKMFRVTFDTPQPADALKLSRKNVAFVTIFDKDYDLEREMDQFTKNFNFFLNKKEVSWARQFKDAILLGPTIEEDMEIDSVELSEAIMHFFSIFWRVLFASVPPVAWGGGWPAFCVALTYIGAVTAVVGECASMFGCVIGMPDSVTAITLVALGTSLPDTFASMTAVKTAENADSAIGNVTGSNSVNVFLGLGLPWVIASTYQENRCTYFQTPPGDLAFSVTVFVICSLLGFLVLGLRRFVVGGELGMYKVDEDGNIKMEKVLDG